MGVSARPRKRWNTDYSQSRHHQRVQNRDPAAPTSTRLTAGDRRQVRPAAVLALGAYLLAVGLLFASRVREFADETDNLLGGLLITRGDRLYVDFFSSHMPLAYYVAAIPALLGAVTLEQFRVFTDLLLILATLGVVWAFRATLPTPVLAIWATLTVFAHTLQWGEMLTASTCAGYGVLVAGLCFSPPPRSVSPCGSNSCSRPRSSWPCSRNWSRSFPSCCSARAMSRVGGETCGRCCACRSSSPRRTSPCCWRCG